MSTKSNLMQSFVNCFSYYCLDHKAPNDILDLVDTTKFSDEELYISPRDPNFDPHKNCQATNSLKLKVYVDKNKLLIAALVISILFFIVKIILWLLNIGDFSYEWPIIISYVSLLVQILIEIYYDYLFYKSAVQANTMQYHLPVKKVIPSGVIPIAITIILLVINIRSRIHESILGSILTLISWLLLCITIVVCCILVDVRKKKLKNLLTPLINTKYELKIIQLDGQLANSKKMLNDDTGNVEVINKFFDTHKKLFIRFKIGFSFRLFLCATFSIISLVCTLCYLFLFKDYSFLLFLTVNSLVLQVESALFVGTYNSNLQKLFKHGTQYDILAELFGFVVDEEILYFVLASGIAQIATISDYITKHKVC